MLELGTADPLLPDASACYCGTALNTSAPQGSVNDCTVPCVGSDTEACGGHGYMSVYELAPANTTGQSTGASSSDGSPASSISAGETETPNTHGSGATFSENKDTDYGGAKSPGVSAGIEVGSVAGIGMVIFLIFAVAKRVIKRRKLQAAGGAAQLQREKKAGAVPASDSATSIETTSATVNTQDAASIRDAMRVDLRRLDGVVMDQHSPSPSPRFSFGSARNNIRETQIGTAATTGAEWKNNNGSSPLTPRTPRQGDVLANEIGRRPSTPTIVVHPPESIAHSFGLGERAWHRRRLSMPLGPPPVAEVGGGDATVDDRRALPSQVPHVSRDGERVYVEAVSALSEEAAVVQSPSWQWTMSSVSEHDDEKTGKQA